ISINALDRCRADACCPGNAHNQSRWCVERPSPASDAMPVPAAAALAAAPLLRTMSLAMGDSEAAPPAPAEADFFGDYSPAVTFAAGAILVLAIGLTDKLPGHDLHLARLYL